jgi:hypothetical protein
MAELISVITVRHVRDHVLWLRFSDGLEGDVDLAAELHGEVFEPLQDVDYFGRVALDPELHTVSWPNGADFAPEFLHDLVRSGLGGVVKPL